MKSEVELHFEKLNESIVTYFKNNHESLHEVKEYFASFIGSNRQLENVQNIQQLLFLLKRRGLYSPFDFNTFRIFQKIIEDERFSILVTRQQKLIKTYRDMKEPLTNIYETARKRNNQPLSNDMASNHESLKIKVTNNSTVPNDTSIPNVESVRNEIFNTIGDGISLAEFRRLARHLDFTKEEIKDIELKCNDFRTQNLVLLNKYESRGNSLTRLLKILNLIEKYDLVRQITVILNRNK